MKRDIVYCVSKDWQYNKTCGDLHLVVLVQVSKHLSDMSLMWNGFKVGDALAPLLFNFSLEYAIRRV
jgi:hypothetical protein